MLVRKKDILSFYDKVKKLAVSSLEKECIAVRNYQVSNQFDRPCVLAGVQLLGLCL